jgi:dihydrofolate reductase
MKDGGMIVSLIAAVGKDGVIGRDGGLPWHLPADLRRFRQLTTGHHILMGRKTYDSIGRPLPDRTTIAITRQTDYRPPGILVAGSLDAALTLAEQRGETEAFIVGGAEIYRLSLPRADRLYLTEVASDVTGDTFFPPFDRNKWHETSREHRPADERQVVPCDFVCYDRRR